MIHQFAPPTRRWSSIRCLLFTVPRHQRRKKMKQSEGLAKLSANRRSFLKKGVMEQERPQWPQVTPGQFGCVCAGGRRTASHLPRRHAILRFLQALEQVRRTYGSVLELEGRRTMRYPAVNGGNPIYMRRSPFLTGHAAVHSRQHGR